MLPQSLENQKMNEVFKYASIIVVVYIFATAPFYQKITLFNVGPWLLNLHQYVDKSREGGLESVILKTEDDFMIDKFVKVPPHINPFNPYAYPNMPGYFLLYKFLGLRGESLWLGQRLFDTLIGLCTVLLVFGIGCLLFDTRIGAIAGVLSVFSPHIWIMYNFDGGIQRAYSMFLCLLVLWLFLLFQKIPKGIYLLVTGVLMGINVLFFHMGSFVAPIIILGYSITVAYLEKSMVQVRRVFYILCIASMVFLFTDILHSSYFNLEVSTWHGRLEEYLNKGIGTHIPKNLLFLTPSRIFDNLGFFLGSVFVDGLDGGSHYVVAPPGVPLIYNYFILMFSLPAISSLFFQKRKEGIFLLVWIFFFLFVYSFFIQAKIKNLFLFVPPLTILAAHGVAVSSKYLSWFANQMKYSETWCKPFLEGVLVGSSCLLGSYFLFIDLPGKNFYDGGSYMGHPAVYRHISERGYTDKTKIVFTSQDTLIVANMSQRLFTRGVPEIINLSKLGVLSIPNKEQEDKWRKVDAHLQNNSDRIFYCFTYFDNLMGFAYVTDNFYEQIFFKIYPETVPFVISGLDGKPLWRIYEIPGMAVG
ncbi:hypothetical protein UR09_04980 [Candidatus Nitromaritima sp. SCGC AAA799-A02]|nr:hypothetical protein UR09_04980 [Candidatus Nitromaritima sp. SCGC AAA799-A02]